MNSRKILFIVAPVALGIAAGIGVLIVNPKAGQNFGTQLYSTGVKEISYSYAVSRVSHSVVNIYVTSLNSDYSSPSADRGAITTSASGVIMSQDGYIVTNYHVVPSLNEADKAILAQTRDGKLYQAFIVGYDRRTDIAVLKIEAQNLSPVPIDDKYDPQVGDLVFAIGNPNNLGQTVTHGIVSATARSGSGLLTRDQMNIREGLQDLIQTDAPINNGNSGGALINSAGNLVGINTASFNGEQTYGIGFAVPFKLVSYVMNEIIKHGRVIRGYLGISDDGTTQLSGKNGVGVRVGYIDPSGPAAGILYVGDVIETINGKRISSLRGLIDAVSGSKPGSEIKFRIQRGEMELDLSVVLSEDKSSID